jgi:sigma-B regulation protein RsbU (phosphoserine phosphatase)
MTSDVPHNENTSGTTAWDGAPCGYLRTSDDGHVLVANDTLLRQLGRARDDVVRKLCFIDLLSGGGRIYHETHFVPMLHMQGEVRALALDLRHTDGTRLPVLVNAQRDTGADGPATTQIVTFDARERRDYERELLLAKRRAEASEARSTALSRTLQATLIPPLPPTIDGLEIATSYRPAGDGSEVGGDFFDVFQVSADDWVIVIGDVEGKGVQAAAVTALARHVIRAASVRSTSPREALLTLNDVLLRAETTRLLTTVVLRLQRVTDGWAATVSAAGHAAPIVASPRQPAYDFGLTGVILGVLTAPKLPETKAVLRPEDVLLMTTDGVGEAWSPTRSEFYGERRVASIIEQLQHGPGAAHRLADALLADVLDFSDGVTRDDLAIVALAIG